MDQGTLSRYLSGGRIPGWRFVDQFLSVAAQQQGRDPTQEERLQARELHGSALRGRGNTKWVVERLERELEEAREEKRYSAKREKLVTRELEVRDERISQLENQIKEIQVQNRMLEGSDRTKVQRAIEHNKADYDQILRERNELEQKRRELIAELAQVRAAKDLAERRCAQLTQELEEAKAKLVAVEAMDITAWEESDSDEEEGADDEPPEPKAESPLTRREKRAVERALDRKTLQVHSALVYLLSFAVSIYLGWVFSSIAPRSALGNATLGGLLIPVALTVLATRTRRPNGSWLRHLIANVVVVTICFILGNRI
ncbi:hypothetical protein E1267_34185 [Nonomuraea longispora]|uniref:Uncharacterized protein n=1 Tax=Nonomuraea longispora TaxID=1848320 RepID=A0A4V2XIY3_9ACTN|nr:hypothetical protein [Nonomuraea longispora]TDC00596.1 hypothetical protein E1267_34185 [Nonomuraea longispora]